MKQVIALLWGLCTIGAALAANDNYETLSVATLQIGTQKIELPKTRLSNGDICQSYVHAISMTPEKFYTAVVDTLCDKAIAIDTGLGQIEYYPEKLRALTLVKTENTMYQVPVFTKTNNK